MAAFTKIKDLRTEEKEILDILKVAKEQLNKLKIQELELINRIREKNVTAATKCTQSEPFTIVPVQMSPEEINRTDLDLAVNKGFNPKNQAAGTSKVTLTRNTSDTSEESEMDSDDDDYTPGKNVLSLFLE